jgi:hypothetical protein
MTKNDVTLESAQSDVKKGRPRRRVFGHANTWETGLNSLTDINGKCWSFGHSRKGPYLPT